jgi:hypothetical protein
LQLNGDPDLRIPGRLEQIETAQAAQRTQLDRLAGDLAATATRRREIQNALGIAIDELHSRIDQLERDQRKADDAAERAVTGQLNALGRRYVIALILALGTAIAGAISTGVLYMLYLELVR